MSNSKINNLDITNAKRPKTKDIAVRDEYGQIRAFFFSKINASLFFIFLIVRTLST